MNKKILASMLLTLPILSVKATKPTDVVATVNGTKITYEEFNKAYSQNKLYVSDKVVTKDKVINDLVNKTLGIQRAKKQKLHENPLVKEKMEEVLYHAQISKDLEPRLKKIVVTDKDIKDYYKDYPEYRTSHALIRVTAQAGKEEIKAAMKQAFKIYNTASKKPEKFAEIANKYSQSSVAPNGGDIGFQPAVKLAPEYFKAIKGKKVGHITTPVRTQFGYHVIKVIAIKEFKDIDTMLYKKIVYDKKRDKILNDYFEDLRKGASIKINKNLIK